MNKTFQPAHDGVLFQHRAWTPIDSSEFLDRFANHGEACSTLGKGGAAFLSVAVPAHQLSTGKRRTAMNLLLHLAVSKFHVNSQEMKVSCQSLCFLEIFKVT